MRLQRDPWFGRLAVGAAAVLFLSGCSLVPGVGDGGSAGPPKVEINSKGNVKGAVARVQRNVDGYEIHIDILRLKRFDKALRLEFAIIPRSNGASDDLSSYWLSSSSEDNVNGVYLLDTNNMRQYSVLTAGEQCVCSRDLDTYPLDQPTVLYADFPVPSGDVKNLTVVFPHIGPVPNVKVS